ncbi:TPA: aldo/keto reductase [Staphylococcus pseudintermedius]|uniref:Aldo/keto reductase n=2 Tax=Staphylococcus pseudintermedius TaxID=283734 RepID=A0A2P5PBZ3_STAPS|nr:aldo/keto reductase [Staphylococcus pseudintermedius]ANQ81613.1 2,5-diketo-D-gluconic acid reductase [Staphylococcus pseudintermedius]ANQ88143.1 2,5-diketo-D-gluconic acid reductase [Staphylococcus pseudintermedius]AYG56436.1 aldo/keto reductase [Staphylococcus pseudintermedius]EGQ0303931.1 aldo/keto reductase [Staphylococcus pseudintermedius]EGQ0363362.1 aldo/keto reductase [Staphylococcus pseudintermedius]
MEQFTLKDGQFIDQLGFGTYKLNGTKGAHAMTDALNLGYRLLDTAYNYENEGAVGRAIQQSHVQRDDIWVTSKLPGRYQSEAHVYETIQESLYRLGLDYLDLYLIHWPNPKQGKFVEAWKAMIVAQKSGLVRHIGVCNFLPEHIEQLEKETGVLPAINQIELHPYFNQKEMIAYHEEKGILTQAWSPLGRDNGVMEEPALKQLSSKYDKTVAQVILRWHIQNGVMPIPKATSSKRQLENFDIFDFHITDEDLQAIDQLTRADGRRKNQDPAVYEEF